MPTTAELTAALNTMRIACEAIREARSMPNGHLYAAMMNFMSHSAYEAMMRQILRTGLVTEKNDTLTWIGE